MATRKTPAAKRGKVKTAPPKRAKPAAKEAGTGKRANQSNQSDKSPRTGLTPKQHRFVHEYSVDMNGTQAAIRAGYSAKTAGSQAERLLKNVDVAKAVAEEQERTAEKIGVTKEMIIDELRKIAFADLRKAVTWGPRQVTREEVDGVQVVSSGVTLVDSVDLDDDTAAAVAEVGNTRDGVKIKLHDKQRALADLAKMLGFMVEKHELTGKNGGPLETRSNEMTPEQRREEIKRLLAENPALIQHVNP